MTSNDTRVLRRYTFKLYPNATQEAALERQGQVCALLWNAALEQREVQWSQQCQRHPKGERRGLSYYDQARELKHLRAADPEIAAMSAATAELTLKALDLAFQAFFRRVKQGDVGGYPQYKSTRIEAIRRRATIWHRDGSGWKLTSAGKYWRVYAKGVPGLLKARGRFPVAGIEHRDMRLIRAHGAWWLSVVVRMEPRMKGGGKGVDLAFDLIDEFAQVKISANGECLPGWEDGFCLSDEQISPADQWDEREAPAEAGETRDEGRKRNETRKTETPAEAGETRDEGRSIAIRARHGRPAEAGETRDAMKSARDTRFKRGSWRWRAEKRRIAAKEAKEARARRDRLHRLTTDLVREASEMVVIAPSIRDNTRSARGTERNPGAAVKTVAMLNRHVLQQAPATAIKMLEYKAAEAGIPFARITPDEHALTIGRELPAATKAARRAARIVRKELDHAAV